MFFFYRNPTPLSENKLDDNIRIPKWPTTSSYPLNYLRIGMREYDPKRPVIAIENGMMDERAMFWHKIGAHLPKDEHIKDEL